MGRILVVDDSDVYRSGMISLIRRRVAEAEVSEARKLRDALSEFHSEEFDLTLLGVDPIDVASVNPLPKINEVWPKTKVAMVSHSSDREHILGSLALGCHGYISKNQSEEAIVSAIEDLLSGRIYIPFRLGGGAAKPSRSVLGDPEPVDMPASMLTPRQREVLTLLTRGLSNKEIARELRIAEATTKIHLAGLLRALGAKNRTEAAFKAKSLSQKIERTKAYQSAM